MSSFRHWEGGEICDASNEAPETKPYTFALLSQQEIVQGIRVVRKLFNVVLSKCHPRGFFGILLISRGATKTVRSIVQSTSTKPKCCGSFLTQTIMSATFYLLTF